MQTVIKNGNVLDTATMSFIGEQDIVIENGVIKDLTSSYSGQADIVIDAKNSFVVPGLIDAHVHFRLATLNFRALTAYSEVEFGIRMSQLANDTLKRGFTTVRDLGGEVTGLTNAIKSGMIAGPRIVRAGHMLTQTGGHGDADASERPIPECACEMRHTAFGIVADGADAVRKAARHLLREGSDFIKVHVSGGVASPSDPIDSIQYTHDELRAAVVEAEHRQTYVAAHAYTPVAIRQAIDAGVHSIEHANLIDQETAEHLAKHSAVMVPTLVTYQAMDEFGQKHGFPRTNLDKNKRILEAGISSLETASKAKVTMGFGTDLIGETQAMQNLEFAIRAEVLKPVDILKSMWQVNPKLCKMEGRIGVLAPGAFGDVVVSSVNPLENIVSFAQHETSLQYVIKHGAVVRG